MAIMRFNSWYWVRVSADLSKFPETLDLRPGGLRTAGLTIFGVVWMIFLWPRSWWISGVDPAVTVMLSLFFLIGVGMVFASLFILTRKRQATFRGDGVEVEGRSLFGSESWYEPYTAFKGVMYRERVVRSGGRSSIRPRVSGPRTSTIYQIIELLHEDPRKCIPLYVASGAEVPRERWETYARQLKLPALDEAGSDLVAREQDQRDKPLRELIETARSNRAFDLGATPPKGLKIARHSPDSLTVSIAMSRQPAWSLGLFILIGLAMMIFSSVGDPNEWILFGFGAIFVASPGYALYRDRSYRCAFTLDRRRRTLKDIMRTNRQGCASLSFDEIEAIAIRRENTNLDNELVIAGEKGQMHVGAGLSRAALAWLNAFLIAAIATA